MYKIASNLTQIKCDNKGPVKDEDGKQVMDPIGCLLGSFRWPPDGVIVPDDFFADDAMFVRLVSFPGLDVYKGDGENWTLLEMEDVDAAGGPSPSARPAPSPDAIRAAAERGIQVYPRTVQRAKPRGPLNEVPPDKVREHLEAMTTKKGKRGRKGQQALDG